MNRRLLLALLLVALILPAVTACGKKAEPVSPSGTNAEYDRKYPAK